MSVKPDTLKVALEEHEFINRGSVRNSTQGFRNTVNFDGNGEKDYATGDLRNARVSIGKNLNRTIGQHQLQ